MGQVEIGQITASDAESAILCSNLEWLHDPAVWGPSGQHHWDDRWTYVLEKWEIEVVPGMDSRCGFYHPSDPSGLMGACGASPHHEHPHIWTQVGYVLGSIRSKTEIKS